MYNNKAENYYKRKAEAERTTESVEMVKYWDAVVSWNFLKSLDFLDFS